jgi:hypothetical protein
MGMRPDGMERWGVVGIFKEAARLLHRHFRLFMPFLLAFHLPASLLAAFQNVFLLPSQHPFTTFAKAGAAYTTAQVTQEGLNSTCGSQHELSISNVIPCLCACHLQILFPEHALTELCGLVLQGADTDSGPSFRLTTYALTLLLLILSLMATAASTYIVAYIYSNADSQADDDSIVKKVFKLLPHAFLRIFVTRLWISVVFLLFAIPCLLLAFVLNAILSAIVGGPSGPTPAFLMVPYIIGLVALSIMFALAESIAVLEPEKFGRAALQQSTKYAKGRASTIFLVIILLIAMELVVSSSLQAVSNAELPLVVEITLVILIGALLSVLGLYAGTVGAVMYFACKSNFEALLPEFQRGSNVSAAENPYQPVSYVSSEHPTENGKLNTLKLPTCA